MTHHRSDRLCVLVYRVLLTVAAPVLLVAFFASGCGGCVLCGVNSDVKTPHESGDATLTLRNLAAAPGGDGGTHVVAVGYSGAWESGSGGSGDGSFNVNQNYEVNGPSVTPAPSQHRVNLRPGRWRMTVTVGDWSATCETQVPKNGGATVIFTYGQSGCQ